MLACFAGKLDVVRILRENGARYDIFDRGGSTALHWAVDGGNVKLLDWMLEEDHVAVDVPDRSAGWTPLLRCGMKFMTIIS